MPASWFIRGKRIGWKPNNGGPGEVGSLSNIHCLPLRSQKNSAVCPGTEHSPQRMQGGSTNEQHPGRLFSRMYSWVGSSKASLQCRHPRLGRRWYLVYHQAGTCSSSRSVSMQLEDVSRGAQCIHVSKKSTDLAGLCASTEKKLVELSGS